MIRKIALLLCVIILMVSGSSYAQKTCGTDELYQQLKTQHPEIAVYEQELEAAIKNKLDDHLAKVTGIPDTTTYDIPIVIHVIHDYGAEDLSDDDIYTAVSYWATVYVGTNYTDTANVIQPFKKYIGNPRIRLHLATKDPNGNPTKGVVRHRSYLTYNGGDNAKLDDWPPTSYVNIWFVNVFNGAYANAAAYAYYPSSGASMPYYDGVIGLYTYLNYDKAIPHEIGHVLNLQHPWGNTNQPGVACGDDLVDDTPPTMGHNPVGCVNSALYDTTCTAVNNIKTYHNILGLDSIVQYPDTVNSQNIMDYTYCQLMFTMGQVYRMRTALTSNVAGRNNLYSPANLAATGAMAPMPDLPPVADFSIERAVTNVGTTAEACYYLQLGVNGKFIFKNQSWNDTVSGVQWALTNGASVPTSTSMATVQTAFSKTGWMGVSLTATSNAGSNTISVPQAVYVADSVAINPYNYVQSFTDSASSANWPTFNYYNNQFKWNSYTGAGYNDNSCMQFRSFDNRVAPQNATGSPRGDYDDMFSPAFDLTALGGDQYLNFYTAGAKRTGGGNAATFDTLDIWVSINGGIIWYKFASLGGTSLDNNATQSAEFIPTSATQWIAQSIAIPARYATSKAMFKFRLRSGDHGNNVYLDNISFSGYPETVSSVISTPGLVRIYPNPSKNGCNIACMAGLDGKVAFQVSDVTGRILFSKEEISNTNIPVQQHIDKNVFPSAGIYIITVVADGKRTTQKLVIEQ